jgi:hypothetical protein
MVAGGLVDRDKLEARIAEAEERLRQSIAQRIERNRSELARLQHEQDLFDVASSPMPGEGRLPPPYGGSVPRRKDGSASDFDDDAAAGPTGTAAAAVAATTAQGQGRLAARTPPTTHGAGASTYDGASEDDGAKAAPTGAAHGGREALLLRMTVDIGDGRTGEVRVRHGDALGETINI